MLDKMKANVSGVIAALGPMLMALGMPAEAAAGLIAVLAWIATWAVPNKPPPAKPRPTGFCHPGAVIVAVALLLGLSACAGKNVSLVTTRSPGQVTYVTLAIDKLAGPACPDAPADVANVVRGERATALLAVARDFYGAKYPGEMSELEKAVVKFQDAIARGVSRDTLEAWAGPAQLQVVNLLAEIIEEEHSYFFGMPSPISAVRELKAKAIPLATRLAEVKATVLEGCESRGYPVTPEFFADVERTPA